MMHIIFKYTAYLSILGSLFISVPAYCQQNIWDRISVLRAFETKTADDTKPALVSFTLPKDAGSSFLINGGVGVDLFYLKNNRQNAVTAFGVYNRNNLISAEQNNFKFGVSAGTVFDLSEKPLWALFGASTGQFMRNYIDTTSSIILTSYWHPVHKSTGWITIGGYQKRGSIVDYFFLPQAGLEYQDVFLANSTNAKGYDVRAYYSAGVNFLIKKKTSFTKEEMKVNMMAALSKDPRWKNEPVEKVNANVDSTVNARKREVLPKNLWEALFEISITYSGRSAFIHHNTDFDNYIPEFVASLNMYPIKDENFSFGLSYNDGANPIDGTQKQTFWLFSINYKKTIK